MRHKKVRIEVTLDIRLSDLWTTDNNDAIAIGTSIERWAANQPTINNARVDIGVLSMKYKPI